MNGIRKRAARLALYLECAGVAPIVDGSTYREPCASLLEQYRSLDPELRWYARLEGRRRIREQGLAAAALRLIPVPAPVCDFTRLTPDERWRVRRNIGERVRRWPQETSPCPTCRIGPGMPKRSWPTRALAEEARSRHKDLRHSDSRETSAGRGARTFGRRSAAEILSSELCFKDQLRRFEFTHDQPHIAKESHESHNAKPAFFDTDRAVALGATIATAPNGNDQNCCEPYTRTTGSYQPFKHEVGMDGGQESRFVTGRL